MTTRLFSGSDEFEPPARSVEDAPVGMRIEFLDVAFSIAERQGDPAQQLHERHDASDFETKTQDKVAAAA